MVDLQPGYKLLLELCMKRYELKEMVLLEPRAKLEESSYVS